MATPLGIAFSTAENQVSQYDDQTFGSTAETLAIHSGQEPTRDYKEVGIAGTPLANSSKQVSVETDKALRKPTTVFWRNKEGQNLEPDTFKNLVVHFDQGKFEELLSRGGPMLHARKHRKVTMAEVSDQKPNADSSQLFSASRVASQVPCEPKSPLPKKMWRQKQKALYEALGAATPQDRLSREDKDKISACFVETISREAKTPTTPSPNSGTITPRANLILMSEATDGVSNTAPVPQDTSGVPSRKARTKAPSGANLLRSKVADKAPQRASPPAPQALSSLFAAELRDCPQVLIAVLMQLQHPRAFSKFLAAKVELKHYLVLTTSAVMKRTRRRPMRNPTQPLC